MKFLIKVRIKNVGLKKVTECDFSLLMECPDDFAHKRANNGKFEESIRLSPEKQLCPDLFTQTRIFQKFSSCYVAAFF
jgi:hypothetical protein